jgi:hypothetical protein
MRVVHLHGQRARQLLERAFLGQMRGEDVLNARAHEEVLLLEAQLLALRRRVVRIQHAREVFGFDLVFDRGRVVAFVEVLDVERLQRARRPQAQMIDGRAAISGHELIEPHREHIVSLHPARSRDSRHVVGRQYASAKAHDVARVGTWRLPDVVQPQPGTGGFALCAVGVDRLREDPVVVADSVSGRGVLQCGQRIEKTGRQPAKTAIAQPRVHLEGDDGGEVVAHAGDSDASFVDELRVETRERIHQGTPGQKLDRQVTQPLDASARHTALRCKPASGQFLSDRER